MNRRALRRPELVEIISQFENECQQNDQSKPSTKDHHECSKAFQTDFYNDVQGLRRSFVNNPFQLENLTAINDTSQLFDDNMFHNLAKLESIGFMQLKTFINDRLISCKTSINSKIALNHFILLNNEKSKKLYEHTADKCLTTQFLIKLRDAVKHRREKAEMLFSSEIFGISQCFSINVHKLYHGTKSNILQRFKPKYTTKI